jgi:cell surface protein SprA
MIPINKIPLFSFVKANYSYTGDYNWQKSSNAFSQLKDIGIPDLGNTVQNARSNNLNTSFNMDMLYKYLGLTKNRINRQIDRESAPKPGEKWSIPMQNHKCRTMNLLMA